MQDAHASPLRPVVRPLAVTFALCVVLAVALPQFRVLRPFAPGSYLPAIFSGLGLAAAVLWNLVTRASVSAMLGGRSLAHWVIEGERWEAFAHRQRARAKRQRTLMLLLSPLLLFPVMVMWGDVDTSISIWLIVSLFGVFGLGTYYATRPGQGAFAVSKTRGEVMLTDSHAVVAGVLYQWSGLHRRVSGVDVEPKLGLIRIHVHGRAGTSSTNVAIEIPFPADAEEEARAVAATLAL